MTRFFFCPQGHGHVTLTWTLPGEPSVRCGSCGSALLERGEDPGADINEIIPALDPDVIEELRARGIEMPNWTPTIPGADA